MGPPFFEKFIYLYGEKKNEDGHTISLHGYVHSVIQEFESCQKTEGIAEVDMKLIMEQCISKFNTYEISSVNYSIKDQLHTLESFGLQFTNDDISLKTNLVVDQNEGLRKRVFSIPY